MGKRSGSGITSRSGGGSGGGVSSGAGSSSSSNQAQSNVVDTTVQPKAVATAAQANAANNARFKDTDNSPYHDLYNGRQYYQDQTFGIDTRMALQDYLNDQPMTGSLYSPSQVLNHKMRTGQPLTANEQFMVDDTDGHRCLAFHNVATSALNLNEVLSRGTGGSSPTPRSSACT